MHLRHLNLQNMTKALKKTAAGLLLSAALPALTLTYATAQSVTFFKNNYTEGFSDANSIAKGADNNFYISGNTLSGTGSAAHLDILLLKVKPSGDTIWKRTLGLPAREETGYCVLTSGPDQVLVAGAADDQGSNSGDAFLMSLDTAGNLVWQKNYPIPGKRTAVVHMKRLDDGIILCGTITDLATDNTDAWLLKTDPDGNMLWHNSYGGAEFDDSWQIEHTAEGGFMLAGGSYSYRTGTRHDDAWLVKTTGTGEEVWIKHHGNADTVDWIWSMAPVGNPSAPDGYVFTGVKNRNPNVFRSEMYLARVDTAGNIVWDIPMTGIAGFREGLAVERTSDNTFYVVGSELELSNSFSLLGLNVDADGNVLHELHYNNPGNEWIMPRSLFIDNADDAYVVGVKLAPANPGRSFLAHIANISGTPARVEDVAATSAISVYPNPATKICTVSSKGGAMHRIILKDATGRVLLDNANPGMYTEKIPLDGMAAGLYFITVYTDGKVPVSLKLLVK